MIPTHKPSRLLRYLPRFFATLLHVLILPDVVQAQFYYTTNNGTITITGYTAPGGAVAIPDTINGLPVTRIGEAAFEYHTSLTSITIPDSVTNIGNYAFSVCRSLTSVTIPNSVTSIGNYAFYYCSGVTNFTIPNTVTSIGRSAFSECLSLTGVTIPNSITSIEEYAFAGCTSLGAITVDVLNSFYSSVDGLLFNKSQSQLIQCPAGKAGSYMIPNSVTSIWERAFYSCASLTGVTIPNSVISIGFEAFSSCTSLTSVTIPNSITTISYGVFAYCTSLTSVTIGNGVTSIGDRAFEFCTSPMGIFFQGNAPQVFGGFGYVFWAANNVTVYYLPGTTGWGTTFGGRPAVLWNPLVQTGDTSFGVRTNRFGFTITGASNLVLLVEAAMNLANPAWVPVGTNTLTGGSSYFSDPEWTNRPARFYRLRSP
jgi:hypothetical protein